MIELVFLGLHAAFGLVGGSALAWLMARGGGNARRRQLIAAGAVAIAALLVIAAGIAELADRAAVSNALVLSGTTLAISSFTAAWLIRRWWHRKPLMQRLN